MADDEFDDAGLAAALATAERNTTSRPGQPQTTVNQPAAASASGPPRPRIEQPKPQAHPSRSGPNSILVSPRQKGNPILSNIKSVPWEYSDIIPDYVVGVTTCALFLSLKYHRLHPEYIYNRIQKIAGKYNLRILLTMVDIQNHEETLKELSKTSLINNVTIVLCWSAQEAGRYLELYKTYEHAAPTSIRAAQSTNYSDKMVDFITVPRSINKTDAVGLVSNFGSIRTAINARPEEVALIAGWGEKKVQKWCNTVREPFRIRKAAKRGLTQANAQASSRTTSVRQESSNDPAVAARLGIGPPVIRGSTTTAVPRGVGEEASMWHPGADEEEAMYEAAMQESAATSGPAQSASKSAQKRKNADEDMSDGITAALARLRQQGS